MKLSDMEQILIYFFFLAHTLYGLVKDKGIKAR